MPWAIGDHALLADGRTAALLDPDGDVAWLCWPRVDSDPCLLAILDRARGGTFALRPRGEAQVASRDYEAGLALHTVWRQGTGLLLVDEALDWEGRPGLLRMLRAEGAPVLVEVRFRPAFAFATSAATMTTTGRRAVAAGAGLVLAVDAPAPWRIEEGVATCNFKVVPGYPTAVALGDAAEARGLGDAPERMAATRRHWRAVEAAAQLDLHDNSVAVRALGRDAAARLVLRSAGVLTGLRQRGAGIVAAPTTSLPQWPGSSRTWDYRYAWLRDAALAARALLRLGMLEDAHGLGAFCGDLCLGPQPPVLARVDESAAPTETLLLHLDGHLGARPVRVGNAAQHLFQLDVGGAVMELAWDLAQARALPESLRRAVPGLADGLARRADEPDHGIWEVRGTPRRYTHSRVLAWSGLRRAAALAQLGVCSGDAAAWAARAAHLSAALLASRAPLALHDLGGGPDAALSEAVLLGLLAPADPRAAATLAAIASGLGRGAGLDRYVGQPDAIDAPCAPFVFPAFWLAGAQERCGLDGVPQFAAAASATGPLGLFGEVVDPRSGAPLGNYPQVQSHASLVLAAFEPAVPEAGPR